MIITNRFQYKSPFSTNKFPKIALNNTYAKALEPFILQIVVKILIAILLSTTFFYTKYHLVK